MPKAISFTFSPHPEYFDLVLERVKAAMRVGVQQPGCREMRLFSCEKKSEIRSYSLWNTFEEFDAYLSHHIENGSFDEQAALMREEIDLRVYTLEDIHASPKEELDEQSDIA